MNLKADIEQKLEAAKKLHQAGQLPDARSAYEAILDLDPDNSDAYRLLSMMALQSGDYDRALDLVDKAIAAQADSPKAHNTRGAVLQSAGRLDEAVDAFRRAVDINPAMTDALYNIGLMEHMRGRLDEAVTAYQRAIGVDNRNLDAVFNLGGVFKQQRKHLAAIEQFQQCIRLDPEKAMAHSNLGSVLNALNRRGEALEAYDEALRIESNSALFHFNRGNTLVALKRPGDAITAYRRAIENKPKMAEAHSNLAEVLMDEGRQAEAVAAYRLAVEAEPSQAIHHHGLAVGHLKGGDVAAAMEACRAGFDANPENGWILSLLADLKEEAGDRDGAQALLDLDRFIRLVQVETPPGYASMESFNEALTEHVCTHPTLLSDPSSHATRQGKHTGELLAEPRGPMAQLEEIILKEGLAYRDSFPVDPDHPFLRQPPKTFKLTAWGVVMGAGGHQIPHIHSTSWLSGVYYPRVPEVVNRENGGHEGWIEFGRRDKQDLFSFTPRTKTIRPQVGMMVLFPSYFFHRTIPFTTDELRVSIAFDLMRAP